jgi:hypothetical protein
MHEVRERRGAEGFIFGGKEWVWFRVFGFGREAGGCFAYLAILPPIFLDWERAAGVVWGGERMVEFVRDGQWNACS